MGVCGVAEKMEKCRREAFWRMAPVVLRLLARSIWRSLDGSKMCARGFARVPAEPGQQSRAGVRM
jgi:hypothetical protein